MTKHYVLNLNPAAEYDWDRCTLRDPITAERPELARLVAEAVEGRSGSYLVSVNIEVTVLEQVPQPSKAGTLEAVSANASARAQEWVA